MSIDPWARNRQAETSGSVRRSLSLRGLREGVRRLFRSAARPKRHTWVPLVDILERQGETLIQVKSSAVDPKDIRIRLRGNALTLAVEMEDSKSYLLFERSILFSQPIQPDDVAATVKEGRLVIRVRKQPMAPVFSEVDSSRRVSDVMSRQVHWVESEATIATAAQMMKRLNIGSLPVCEDGRMVGILSDRDIALRVAADGQDPLKTPVAEIMTRKVVSCSETDSLVCAEMLMHDEQVRRLPVLDRDGRLVGFLALATVALTEEDPARIARVLKGVSQPGRPKPLKVA